MAISSYSIKKVLTKDYGFMFFPYVELTETYAQVTGDTAFSFGIGGLTLQGSILKLDSVTPIINESKMFADNNDIVFRVGVGVDIWKNNADTIMQHITYTYGGSSNPTLYMVVPILVKTSDDKCIWGLYSNTAITGQDAIDSIIEYPPTNSRTGMYSITVADTATCDIILRYKNSSAEAMTAFIIGKSEDAWIDPYYQGGYSGTGGGAGTFSGTGDDISIPALPTLSAVDTGLVTLFNPTLAQLQNLASYMWAGAFDPTTFKKLFADPMDAILGLSIVPVNVTSSGTATVSVGNISTGISMNIAASQFVEVDCGSLAVSEYWGSYLDYDPYTKIEIYLPYVGTHALSVDDVMGKTLTVKYHVDILSGACNAYVKCGGSVLYTFIGQCSAAIPITGNEWTNVINGVLSAGVSIGSMVATGGATAPLAVPQLASTAINSMKPTVEKSGAMSGVGGMLGVQTPYLIITRPRQALPKAQNTFMGYPSFINEKLGNLTGYTEVEEIHLNNVPATDDEITEIMNLLKSGVIF